MKIQIKSLAKPVLGKLIWFGFAAVFFYSGLFFTEWLLETDKFAGGWRWIMVAAFPLMVPGFFWVNRRYGCAAGRCGAGSCNIEDKSKGVSGPRMPLA